MKRMHILYLFSISMLYPISINAESIHPGTLERNISGKLPIVYINTADSTVIDQKETYLDATYWIDPMGIDGIDSLGSAENPLPMLIRGRGNSSWTFPKKPYKIKLPSKQSILGMPAHKHWALLAHYPEEEFIHENLCFELARRIDIGWVPRQEFCEVVLNGRCVGLYSFSEVVKTGKDRLNIYEQDDENVDESVVHGGWLIEIDNTDDVGQIYVTQPGTDDIAQYDARFTHKMPEMLSPIQLDWLVKEFTAITEAIFDEDILSTKWEEYIDITRAARYYIIQESTGNLDAYVGSTYLYKDLEGKWMFGPIWDSGWTYTHEDRIGLLRKERERAVGFNDTNFVWIEQLLKFPRFQRAVVTEWRNYYGKKTQGCEEFIDNISAKIEDAWTLNYEKIWPGNGWDLQYVTTTTKDFFKTYNSWMDSYVSELEASCINDLTTDTNKQIVVSVTDDGTIKVDTTESIKSVSAYNIFGQRVGLQSNGDGHYSLNSSPGLYVVSVKLDDLSRHSFKVRL